MTNFVIKAFYTDLPLTPDPATVAIGLGQVNGRLQTSGPGYSLSVGLGRVQASPQFSAGHRVSIGLGEMIGVPAIAIGTDLKVGLGETRAAFVKPSAVDASFEAEIWFDDEWPDGSWDDFVVPPPLMKVEQFE